MMSDPRRAKRRDGTAKQTTIALLFVAGLSHNAFAGDTDHDVVLDQLQAEFSVCTAFYTLEESCGADGETRRRLSTVRRRAEALARAISMSADEVALRLEIALMANRSFAAGCNGLERLETRYAVQCDPLSSGPQ
jgi:hypothetical protein